MIPKRVAILGSTGSIGRQALDVIHRAPADFEVSVLTTQNNVSLLIEQALAFKPGMVVVGNEAHYAEVAKALSGKGIDVRAGEDALALAGATDDTDIVLTALVGYVGLLPTMKSIEAGKTIALANKETLVVAGALITALARKHNVSIYPVDSEHSAIFQCLVGEDPASVEKIVLTASGGPFLGRRREALRTATLREALQHPNWSMGSKITVDSSTLMNKGFEAIEARWLFDVDPGKVEVVIHPQSIIHSIVQFCDGSMKAQMGPPDMRLPIQYALAYPERLPSTFPRMNFSIPTSLTFEPPDTGTFGCLRLALEAMATGGNTPCILNAANEVAVAEFLAERIGFLEIEEIVEQCLSKVPFIRDPNYGELVKTDEATRVRARELAKAPRPA